MANRPLTRKEWMAYLEKACNEFDWEGASKPCPDCERYKQSASMWRHKAYELGGTSLPWKPEELLREEYERGFIDGMQKQMQSSVDKAVNGMARQWVGLTDDEVTQQVGDSHILRDVVRAVEHVLKEKNHE